MRLLPMHPATPQAAVPETAVPDGGLDTKSAYTVIYARLLIPGLGEPVRDGAVVIKGPKIEWVGPFQNLPSDFRNVRPTYVQVIMPGLWDCHVHYMGVGIVNSIGGFFSYLPQGAAQVGAVTVRDLHNTLMAGYTSVRELTGFAGDLWPLVEAGHIVGPNVYSSIGALSTTGGHGDDHEVPLDFVLTWSKGSGNAAICDGVDECIKTVRQMIRRGARCIKVCSTGGVLSLNDDPEDQQFSDEELKAIVDEAARSGRGVAAHAIGKAGILSALRAGVKSIEHGMYLDEEVADLMIEKGATFVGTHHIVTTLFEDPELVPEPMRKKLLKLIKLSETSYQLAIKKGVKIALGTDTFSSDPSSALHHGSNAKEIYWAVKMGMTPLQAIQAATANAPEVLARKAPLSGQLREGYDADLIAVSSNHLNDVKILQDTKNITHVWKGGVLFKRP